MSIVSGVIVLKDMNSFGLGISIVDSTPRELLYCGASMIKMRLERKEIDTSTHNAASTSTSSATSTTSASSLQEKRSSLHVACQIGSLQIDNQLPARGVPDCLIWYPIPFELKFCGWYRTKNVRYRKNRLSDIGTDLFM